jgi:hypothetical protein
MRYAFEVQYEVVEGAYWWTLRITTDTAQWTSGSAMLFIGGNGRSVANEEEAKEEMARQMNALVKALGLKREQVIM